MSFVLYDIDIHNEEVSFARSSRCCCCSCCLFMLMQLKDYQTRNMGANLWSNAVSLPWPAASHYMFLRILRIRYVVVLFFIVAIVLCACVCVLKGNNRMRFAGHNNHLCPVTSCHISCMINESISACPFSPQHSQAATKREHIR